MANRVVLNCRKISRTVTCTVTGTNGRTVIVVDENDDDDDDDDDGVTKDVGGKKEVFSGSEKEEENGEGASGLGITTIDCKIFFFSVLFIRFIHSFLISFLFTDLRKV